MKKLLSILLCCLLLLTSLAACNNESENSSEASSQQAVSSETEGSTESSEESLDSSEEWVAPEPYVQTVKAPENTVYFKGIYNCIDTSEYKGTIFDSNQLLENRMFYDGSLKQYINENNPSDDTYFMVRIIYSCGISDKESEIAKKDIRQRVLDFLNDYDYIDIDDHPLICTGEYYKEIWALTDTYDILSIRLKYLRDIYARILPSVPYETIEDIFLNHNSFIDSVFTSIYPAIGYISAGAIREIAETELPEGHYILVLWCPAPDDQERWLTYYPAYEIDG